MATGASPTRRRGCRRYGSRRAWVGGGVAPGGGSDLIGAVMTAVGLPLLLHGYWGLAHAPPRVQALRLAPSVGGGGRRAGGGVRSDRRRDDRGRPAAAAPWLLGPRPRAAAGAGATARAERGWGGASRRDGA